jgi:chromosome segregation ATPase
MVMDKTLSAIKEKLEKARDDKVRCEEQLKVLEQQKNNLLKELKELGVNSFEDIDKEIDKLQKEVDEIMQQVNKLDEGYDGGATIIEEAEDVSLPDVDDILKDF